MLKLVVHCWLFLALSSSITIAQTFTVRSGNGTVGGKDSAVTFLQGPTGGNFSSAFTSADFASAQAGPAAFILSQTPYWMSALPSDPSARWIGTNSSAGQSSGNTALYAISFTIPSAFFSASLTLNYAVDDELGCNGCANDGVGTGPNDGVFLNGTQVCPGTLIIANDTTDFTQEHTVTCSDVSSLLQLGTNWLYIDAVNFFGGPAGLLFSATITTSDLATPPSSSFGVGSNPSGIAFDGANIWVANSGLISAGGNSNSVTKLRAIDGATLGNYAVGDVPWQVAFDGANIWVANNGPSQSISKLRASDGAALGTFPIIVPYAIAFDGTDVWATSFSGTGTDSVVKLRPSDGAELGAFPVGNCANGIAFDGANIWVENSCSNNVTKLRASDGSNLGTFSVGSLPKGVVFDGTNIWVANNGDNTVTKLRPSDGALLGTFRAGSGPWGLVFDGANIWVADHEGNTVTQIRASDGTVLGVLAVGTAPLYLAFDGANIWVTNEGSDTVSKLPISSTTAGPTISFSPSLLNFTYQSRGALPPAQAVTVGATSPAVAFTASASGGSWLSVSPTSGTTPASLSVSVNPAGQNPGTYNGTIIITAPEASNSPQTVSVSLTVTSAPTIISGTLSLPFNYQLGGTDPLPQVVLINASVAGSSFTVQKLTSATWLTVSPTSGEAPETITVSVNPANLGLGTYNGTIIVSGANGVAGTVTLNVSLTVTGPLPTINPGGLVNAASNSSGPVAPGSIAAVMGSFPLASSSTAPSGPPWPTNLGGLSIQFDGIPAPIYYASASQVNLQVPWELTGSTQVPVTATVGTQTSSPQTTNLAPFSPGLFSMNAQGSGQGAILNLQYLLVDSSNPASVGDVIQIYCTGLGAVTNQPASGALAPVSPLAQTTTPPVVTIGGTSAKVLYSGLAPGAIGLYQLDAQIPTGILTGPAVPVMVSLGGMTSNTVTLAIQPFPNPQPAITGLSPSSATAGTGPLTLTISGSGFIASSTVTYNSSPHPLSSVGSNQLTITLSTADLAAVGTFPVIVSNPASGGGNSNPVNFTVSPPANPQPLITSLTPSSATAGTNSLMLAINGSGFIVSSTVTFNGVSHSPSLVNSGQLTITLTGSDLAAAGSFPVFVTNPPPGGGVSNSMTFSVLPPATNGLTGNWTGTWGSIPTGVVGTVSAKLVQTGTALTGSISLNSTCFPGGPLSGTVIGSAINATITISGIQLASLDGTVTTSNSIEGAYLVSYSLCTDYGFYFLNRAQ